MARGSDTHGPKQDDYLKKELHGLEQADHPTRAEEWRDPEPPADDDPALRDPRGAGEVVPITVAEVMTPHVISVSPATPVAEAAELMRDNDIGSIFVIDGDRPVGTITDRDLALRVLAPGLAPETTAAGDVCTPDPATVLADSDANVAHGIMRDRVLRRLLVVGPGDRPQGVVTLGDLAVAQDRSPMLADIIRARPPSEPED